MSLLESSQGVESLSIDPASCALLLDIDGTLLDIAENPDEVIVPAELHAVLARLQRGFGGAVALISGRSLSTIDHLFPHLALFVVGCHGAEVRLSLDARTEESPNESMRSLYAEPLSPNLRARLKRLGEAHPGVIVEDKIFSVALHYRSAPAEGPALRARAHEICAEAAGEGIGLLEGKGVVEVKPVGIDKGRALRTLLGTTPFRGRRPVFIGDDVTDEAAFAALGEFSGIGISVGRPMAGADHMLAGPGEVRTWLAALAVRAEHGR